jgi:hypothetical protein
VDVTKSNDRGIAASLGISPTCRQEHQGNDGHHHAKELPNLARNLSLADHLFRPH